MKAFTDLEQSKKLAEILPLESANMYYKYVLPKSNKIMHNPVFGSPIEALEWYNKGYTHFGKEPLKLEEYCIPCWSLTALLEVLQEYDLTKFAETECSFLCYCKGGDKLVYSPTPVDACVKMIELIAKEEDISRRKNDYGKNSD